MITPLLLMTIVLQAAPAEPAEPDILTVLRRQAQRCTPLVKSPNALAFLGAVETLPHVQARTLLHDPDSKRYWRPEAAASLAPEQRARLEEVVLDEEFYYTTRYGTPIAYCRALDLAAGAGLHGMAGRRILDFGYGSIGHLRMMAALGADVVGVEVDPLLAALYAWTGDQGQVPSPSSSPGRLLLVHGRFPAETETVQAVGGGFHLILSKNVLKRGYIHPERPVDERKLVRLGVEDEVFCRRTYEILEPGGLFMIYNLSPKQNPPDQPFIPWADGRCPFTQQALLSAGFEIIALDQDDTSAARSMARALEWDQPPSNMDVDQDLFGHYTLLRRPR